MWSWMELYKKKKSKYLAICLEGMQFTYLGSHVWTLRLGLVYKCVGVGFVIGDEVILWNYEVNLLKIVIEILFTFDLGYLFGLILSWY